MSNTYTAYNFTVSPLQPATEILIAELGNVGFESFVENENGFIAYIQKKDDRDTILDKIYILKSDEFKISFTKEKIEQVNWNSEWEKNFNPIQVDGLVSVRAPFHTNPNLKYDIVIEPKMSFGTGHHETTHMMIQHLLKLDLNGKYVLDMGCGTGILGIFAEKLGANWIDAVDIDDWCVENTLDNLQLNNSQKVNVHLGDASTLGSITYDVIIANINRNILLKDIRVYARCLKANGILLLSGFYKEDIPMIEAETKKRKLSLEKTIEQNNCVALKYVKGQIVKNC